ncbi:hypothetical protein [Nannocystis pusilla]|uniref:hypothetical protein n=1 Tax=Nannocystis pusilla TaxID=889268 RepID=UPI003B7F8769
MLLARGYAELAEPLLTQALPLLPAPLARGRPAWRWRRSTRPAARRTRRRWPARPRPICRRPAPRSSASGLPRPSCAGRGVLGRMMLRTCSERQVWRRSAPLDRRPGRDRLPFACLAARRPSCS